MDDPFPHTSRAFGDSLFVRHRQVIAATNRPDVLDPALLRSGRLDRKIELPHPSEEARGRIIQIHSRKMNVDKSKWCAPFAVVCVPLPFSFQRIIPTFIEFFGA